MIRRLKRFKFDLSFPCMQPKVFQRLGETQATDIEVQVLSEGVPYNLTGVRFGFEMRDDEGKIVIDEDQSRFTLTDVTKGKFTYRVSDNVFGFDGNAYLCYFVLKISGVRITTERFIITNDEDVQKHTSGLREHYVSVIDDLVASNKQAMEEAQKIKAMIEANQVVKKSGDTMTGNLNMSNEKSIGFLNTSGARAFDSYLSSGGTYYMRNVLSNKAIYSINSAGFFDMITDTNLLKKTGDTMTGNLTFQSDTETNIPFRTKTTNQEYVKFYANPTRSRLGVYSTKNSKNVWDYDGDTDSFKVNTNTNLLKKTGDTATGHMIFRHNINQETSDGLKGVNMVVNSSVNKWSVAPKMDGNPVWANEFSMDLNTGKVTVSELATKKDGRANLILNSGFTNFDTNYPVIADRRGNNVTLRGAVRRDSGTTGDVAFTLPSGMIPLVNLPMNLVTNEGVSVRVIIATDGSVKIGSQNSAVYISFTYVVN